MSVFPAKGLNRMRHAQKKVALLPLVLTASLLFRSPLNGGIILNEISAGGSEDWVELKLTPDSTPIDISPLFVTMYYGTNEKISGQAVTLYPSDLPGTPWDDRFAVIHFAGNAIPDETDSAGDLNSSRVRDLYCVNYGLWNTDCCVSIDTDDDPANNGILDFVAFSNRDGSVNTTIASYINSASGHSMWQACASSNLQECCVFIGSEGMNTYSTLSRVDSPDTDSMDDFIITPYATPGRDNITEITGGGGGVLRTLKKQVTYNYDSSGPGGSIELPLFFYGKTSIRIRIFNTAGYNIYTGPLLTDINPGYYTAAVRIADLKCRLIAGLYPVSIEAVNSDSGRTESVPVILVVVRKR